MIIFFLLFILLLILMFIISNYNYNKNINNNKDIDLIEKEIKLNNNSYFKYGNEEDLKDVIIGYENELMYENNLKDGDYINQFKENNIININDNQIGFNPKPREQMKQLPYANIHFKCL
jgi:hypothetical protein